MAITDLERYSGYKAIFDSLEIPDVQSVTPSAAIQKMLITPAGALDPAHISLVTLDPVASVTCFNLGNVFTSLSPSVGLAISTLAKLQFQQRNDGGAFKSGSNHVTITSAKGFLAAESLQAQQDDQSPAQLQLKYWGLKSGSTPAMQINVSQALSGSPAVAQAYRLGPVVIDGTILGGVQRSQVNFNCGYTTKRANGDQSPTVGSITKRGATAELMGNNFSLANATDFALTACATSIIFYYLAQSGTSHLALTFPAGSTYELSETPAQGDQDAETRIMVTAAGAISVDTAAAYPS